MQADATYLFNIKFYGRPIGCIGAGWENVEKTVRAKDPESAALKAYDTHEHIRGGADRVTVTQAGGTND